MFDLDNADLEYRDPKTGEPTAYVWSTVGYVNGKTGESHIKTDRYYFKDYTTEDSLKDIPYLARSPNLTQLWRQWWQWKRGELK